jgi:hypothetical protein
MVPSQRLQVLEIRCFSALLAVPGDAIFTGASSELSGVMLRLDQYQIIILMLYHQSPSSN